jgi:hypothetical protein
MSTNPSPQPAAKVIDLVDVLRALAAPVRLRTVARLADNQLPLAAPRNTAPTFTSRRCPTTSRHCARRASLRRSWLAATTTSNSDAMNSRRASPESPTT